MPILLQKYNKYPQNKKKKQKNFLSASRLSLPNKISCDLCKFLLQINSSDASSQKKNKQKEFSNKSQSKCQAH